MVFLSMPAFAGDDPDHGMKRAMGIEESWIENAAYVSTSRDNDARQGHAWDFGVQWDVALSEQWGGEIDGPALLAQQPLGRAPSALAPITVGLKYVPLAWEDGDDAAIAGMELEGGWWAGPQPANFPGTGSTVAEQALLGIRHGRYWLQGEYGLSQRAGADARSGWYANSALGWKFSENWVFQIEFDLNRTGVDALGHTASVMTLTPQMGWQINSRWQMVVGESVVRTEGEAKLAVMTNVLFEYSFDADMDATRSSGF